MKKNKDGKATLATVVGTGSASVPNDQVDVAISLKGSGASTDKASAAVFAKVEKLKAMLLKGSDDPVRFSTDGFYVSPKVKQVKKPDGTLAWERDGFEGGATESLTFPLDKKARWAKAIDAILSAFPEDSVSLSFGSEKPQEVEQRILQKAVKNGLEKAEAIGEACGKKVARIASVEQVAEGDGAARPMLMMARSASAESLQPSSATLSFSVRIVVELK